MRGLPPTFAGLVALTLIAARPAAPAAAPVPSFVDITWMSITNMYYELGPLRIVTDGYITRLPREIFSGGGGGLAKARPSRPDVAAVTRVMTALGGPSSVNLLLNGHAHFDHSFDTAVWSTLTGARIIGSQTTCFQARAQKVPEDRCAAVVGGERIALADGVTMRVIRWNHSGAPAANPEQHNAVELDAVPRLDAATGGLDPGVAADFPNGGGNRAFLFVVDAPGGRFSWLFQNSASAVDLDIPIVVGGKGYGAPIDNLKAAIKDAGLDSVDLWIGTGGAAIAERVLPIVKPRAYLPVHWDSFWTPFRSGVDQPFADPALKAVLDKAGVQLVVPVQYMDKWRLDRAGIRAVSNAAVKKALGFKEN
jgi:L-ascorbate metabolism protein UlaG (beta-lactamase superfamily)